jgi:squid-like protein
MADVDFTQDVVGNGNFGEANIGTIPSIGGTSEASNGGASTSENNVPKGTDDNIAADRKLFAGGLSWETREAQLKEYFEKFGEVESVNLKLNPMTGRLVSQKKLNSFDVAYFVYFDTLIITIKLRLKFGYFCCRSRCFAFVVFKEPSSLDAVLEAGEHAINSKKVDVKKAKAKPGKMFLGGLKPELSDDEIRTHFEQFGTIIEFEMPFDKTKDQRKGFGFITYEREETMKDLIKKGKVTIGEHEIDLKKATPKNDQFFKGGGPPGYGGGAGGSSGPYADYYGYDYYGASDYYGGWGGQPGYGGSGGWGSGGGKMRGGRGRGQSHGGNPY